MQQGRRDRSDRRLDTFHAELSPNIYVTGGEGSTKCRFGDEKGPNIRIVRAGGVALKAVRMTRVEFDSPTGARYNNGMNVQTFSELLTQRPFKPFRLVMSSGQAYDVRHPEMAWMTRSDILVGIDETDEGVPAEFKICSMLHVSAIEPLSSATR